MPQLIINSSGLHAADASCGMKDYVLARCCEESGVDVKCEPVRRQLGMRRSLEMLRQLLIHWHVRRRIVEREQRKPVVPAASHHLFQPPCHFREVAGNGRGTAAGTDDIHIAAYRFRNRSPLATVSAILQTDVPVGYRSVRLPGVGSASAVSGLMRMPNLAAKRTARSIRTGSSRWRFQVTNQTDNAVFRSFMPPT